MVVSMARMSKRQALSRLKHTDRNLLLAFLRGL
jgi:hypothetical protein